MVSLVVRLLSILFLVGLSVNCSNEYSSAAVMKNLDPNYGQTWMFMPDGDGNLHIVDMTIPDANKIKTDAKFVNKFNNDIKFYLYNKDNKNTSKLLKKADKGDYFELDESYNPKLPTKFIIHGWRSSYLNDVCQDIKNAYLAVYDINVCCVDWSSIAKDNLYIGPVLSTRDVGRATAQVIDYMVLKKGADINDIHVIGHSLGAHTAGYAGMFSKSGKVSRITGLDPALPGFTDDQQPNRMLDKSDAQFVDVIHTCAGLLGHNHNLGHADFYPNGGTANQPGCDTIFDFVGACSHGRSYYFFAESITIPNGFMSFPCESQDDFRKGKCKSNPIPMGDQVPRTARGMYYLETGGSRPYSRSLP